MPRITAQFVTATLKERAAEKQRRETEAARTGVKPEPLKDVAFWDSGEGALTGFGIRIKPSNAASFVCQYRDPRGRTQRMTVGQASRLPVTDARKAAAKILARVELDQDPAQERRDHRAAATVAEFCEQYLGAVRNRVKANTLKNDRSRISAHIVPLLGKTSVKDLKPSTVDKFYRDVIEGKTATAWPTDKSGKRVRGAAVRGGVGAANRALDLLVTILERAVRDETLLRNPAIGVQRVKSRPKRPPFSFAAVKRLGTALYDRADDEQLAAQRAIRALLLTGCRRTEILTLRWRMIDAPAHCLRLEDSKTGASVRPAGAAALSFFASFRPKNAKPDDYVFPGRDQPKRDAKNPPRQHHFVGLPKAFQRIAAAARVKNVSLHGLRHFFASAAAEMGYSELIIAPLLGHSGRGITSRYANAPDTALVAAADAVAGRLAEALQQGVLSSALDEKLPE